MAEWWPRVWRGCAEAGGRERLDRPSDLDSAEGRGHSQGGAIARDRRGQVNDLHKDFDFNMS